MADSIDRRLLKVAGLVVAAVAGLALVLSQMPGVVPEAMFGSGPVGTALTIGVVVLGIAGYVVLEVSAGEAFAD
jgi:hypothetical protein